MMAHKSSSNPSDHPTTAAALQYRGLRFRKTDRRNPPRNLTDICVEFRQVVQGSCRRRTNPNNDLFGGTSLESLQAVMTSDHINEIAFDKALFRALRGCVIQCRKKGGDENYIILSTLKDSDKYAVGFARQVRPALDLMSKTTTQNNISTDHTSSTSSGRLEAQKSQSDHSVCLFEKEGKKWNIKECFGIVELKMSDTNCGKFNVDDNNAVKAVDLRSSHGALGQAILYTIGSVVLFHARNGILEPTVPVAVIAARRKMQAGSTKRQKISSRLRWVSSLLNTPEQLGGRYSFSVDDFGGFFEMHSAEDTESAALAVRLYLDAMLFALKIAIGVRNIRNGGNIPQPVPASGRYLMIGERKLEHMEFCASPIPGAKTIIDSSWKISQGELFRGEIDLHAVLQQQKIVFVDFRSESEQQNTATVRNALVKVSSTAVHSLLIAPSETMLALEKAKQGGPELVERLGKVLKAAVRTKIGMITIMSDLRKEGYTALTPKLNGGRYLPTMWAGFASLVTNVLLPMAEMEIIHPDIRPGYDVTSNVLCRLQRRDDGTVDSASMMLIDFESLVFVDKWESPQAKDVVDGRFVPLLSDWDATTYVWWQVVFVAYVWKNKILAGDVGKASEGKKTVIDFLEVVLLRNAAVPGCMTGWPPWLVALRDIARNGGINATRVESTLVELAKLFTER